MMDGTSGHVTSWTTVTADKKD